MTLPRLRLALASAVILGLTACGSAETEAAKAPDESPASSPASAAATPTEEAPSGPSPLDSIPEEPYGYSLDELRSVVTGQTVTVDVEGGPLTYAASNEMAPDAAGVDFSGALQTAFQVDWVGAQRDTIFNGWRMENIRGNVEDIKHFVAPSNMDGLLPDAEKSLAAAEALEKGETTDFMAQDYYVLHVGQMLSNFDVTDEQKAAWPGYEDSVVWMKFGEEHIPVPRDAKATYSAPIVTKMSTYEEAESMVVNYTNMATAPMADGRSVRMVIEREVVLVMEGGAWKVHGGYGQIVQTGIAA